MEGVKHISHRGGCSEAPENTIAAFRNALQKGTEMFELDVHITKDKKVVVFHDSNLKRVTGVDKHIRDMNYIDLPTRFVSPLEIPFIPGTYIETSKFNCQIPLLEDVFREFPETPVNIDLKDRIGFEDLLTETHKVIKKYKREKLVVWGSFNNQSTSRMYQKDSSIPLCCSFQQVVIITLSFYIGLLPYLPIKESFFEIPLYSVLPWPGAHTGHIILGKIIFGLLGSKRLYRHLNRRGITVYSWVQNTDEDFRFCYKECQVNAMMTDSPTKMTNFLNQTHGWN
jgi:glycerophosphoryl diester phosphodiesterase